MQPSIYQYLDFRKYLRDSVAARRLASPTFSLGVLSRRTGCLTKPHLSLIMSGKRGLSGQRAEALGRALGLSGTELRYYQHLIKFNQAKCDADREQSLNAMMSELQRRSGANLPLDSYRALDGWPCLAIRELARLPHFDPSPQAISSRLKGLVGVKGAKQALRTLIETGLLIEGDDGCLQPSNETLRTTDEINSIAVRKYHKSCMDLAKQILDLDPVEEREFGSVNILLRPEDKPKLKELIKTFREQVLTLAASGGTTNARVSQINVQMFDLSK